MKKTDTNNMYKMKPSFPLDIQHTNVEIMKLINPIRTVIIAGITTLFQARQVKAKTPAAA